MDYIKLYSEKKELAKKEISKENNHMTIVTVICYLCIE
jgi:hypothetical protein